METAEDQAPAPRFGMLRIIAVYKIVKVLLLLGAAYGEIRLHDASLSGKLVTWVQARPSGLEHQVVTQLLQWFSGLSEAKIHALRFVTLTASLIPLEIWELVSRPNIGKAAVVLANAVIVAYLIWHVRSKQRFSAGSS
jgi:hypothetical protein